MRGDDHEQPGAPCQGRSTVRAHRERLQRADSRGARRAGNGREEHHGSAAARGGAGDGHHDLRDRSGRAGGGRGPLRARGTRLRRGAMQLSGLGVSPGVGIGKALVLKRGSRDLRFRVPAFLVDREVARLMDAREKSREQIQQIKERISRSAGAEHAYLFDAQLLMLDDAMLIERAKTTIRNECLNAESALQRALDHISALFDQAQDTYLRERKGDVADVVGRLCMNLRAAGDPADLFRDIEGPLVLVADEITPSVIAQLDWQRLAALVTDAGSWSYHTAILARSIRVPAVAGLRNASSLISPGSVVAVDGATGEVLVDPEEAELQQVHARQRRRQAYERSLDEYRDLPAVTEDGVEVRLEANVESPDDAVRAMERGAEGIGLFRSEFLLAGAGQAALTEDTQYAAYRKLVESAAGRRVTIRTF